jgi:hypothetical protein
MMIMHGVECDFDKVTGPYPKGKDGHDISPKEYLKRARVLSERLAHFLAERNAKKKAAREQKRNAKGASSSRAASSLTQDASRTEAFSIVMNNVVLTSVYHELVNLFAA